MLKIDDTRDERSRGQKTIITERFGKTISSIQFKDLAFDVLGQKGVLCPIIEVNECVQTNRYNTSRISCSTAQ